MRRTADRRGVLAAALLTLGAFAGCRTAHLPLRPDPGVTGYAMIGPYSVQRFIYPVPVVERAAVEAMADMKMHTVKRKPKENGICLQGFLYDGRYIIVTLETEGTNTIVSVVIDVYGDEPMSKILIDRISSRISTMPQSVVPTFEPRALSDSVLHRGQDVEGYRGKPLR